jgi:hypothetical protein
MGFRGGVTADPCRGDKSSREGDESAGTEAVHGTCGAGAARSNPHTKCNGFPYAECRPTTAATLPAALASTVLAERGQEGILLVTSPFGGGPGHRLADRGSGSWYAELGNLWQPIAIPHASTAEEHGELAIVTPAQSSAVRATSMAVAFVFSAALSWTAVDAAVTAASLPPSVIGQDFVDGVQAWRRQLRQIHRDRTRVALLGDSVLGAPPGERSVADAINASVGARGTRGRRVELHQLSWPGWGIAAQYFLADEIVRGHPDRIMLELNMRGLGPASAGDLSHPELAGLVRTNRLAEAAWLPLSDAGVTLDQLLFYRLLVANHLDGDWASLRRQQADAFRLRGPVENWLDSALGSTAFHDRTLAEALCLFDRLLVPGKNRERKNVLKRSLGNALAGIPAGHPRLQLLRALLERFHRARIPTVVWVAPVNVEHVRSEGLPLDGLEASVATLRGVVESAGAGFVDFHALLPDRAFRDAGDHVTSEGDGNGTSVLGEHLAQVLLWSEPAGDSSTDTLVEGPARAP